MTGAELSAVLGAVPLPIVFIGADDRVQVANDKAEALFGDALVGRHYATVLRRPALLTAIETARLAGPGGAPSTGRIVLADSAGDSTFRVTARAVAAQGGGAGVLVAFEDVSHLGEAMQMRRDFVANVSHELKTPLTALAGFIETLQGPARDDAAARERFLAIMAREAERMNRLVGDLLSLSRVEAEARQRPTAPVDLAAILATVRGAIQPAAAEAGASLEVHTPDTPLIVPGDADQLTQVFINLVENAVKYGGSRVELRAFPPAPDAALRGPAVRVEVVDNGEGIDPVHLPRLTERFYRIDSHRSREKGGTGLGLAIVKHIVSRHRGRLSISSEPGKGSRFAVILPAE